jgi:ribosomal protein S18 acetylase RimI-like enzyme
MDTAGCMLDRIMLGPDPELRRAVAEVWYEPFGAKLTLWPILPPDRERAIDLVAATLVLDEVYVALAPDDTVLASAWGTWGGTWRLVAWRLLGRGAPPARTSAWGLEGFAVAPACRGRGVGSAMLARIFADAATFGFESIELTVGDTNLGAQRLYERSGFRRTRTIPVGPFSRRLGFKRFIEMKRSVTPDPRSAS